ncbi:DsbA family protein [Thalassospira xiamenensis]|uniref:Protein-disulfide isomerase n=1 Tax=Thalassospira xiamenensis TaxID=220697 RepID=A0A285TY05_9PROT|nr:thioredoxin domain-containing protein [Thalassospira xiamenensis]SOC27269.1 Protein-disulfide isomerase [Thalassospira xiamenensis]
MIIDRLTTILVVMAVIVMTLLIIGISHSQGKPRVVGDLPPQGSDIVFGVPDAMHKVDIFVSMTCPHCHRLARETLVKLVTRAKTSNELRVTIRQLPLNAVSLEAATFLGCMPSDVRHEAFTGLMQRPYLMSAVTNWPKLAPAEHLAAISECMEQDAMRDSVVSNTLTYRKQYGIQVTPTIVVDGFTAPGFASPHELSEILGMPNE